MAISASKFLNRPITAISGGSVMQKSKPDSSWDIFLSFFGMSTMICTFCFVGLLTHIGMDWVWGHILYPFFPDIGNKPVLIGLAICLPLVAAKFATFLFPLMAATYAAFFSVTPFALLLSKHENRKKVQAVLEGNIPQQTS